MPPAVLRVQAEAQTAVKAREATTAQQQGRTGKKEPGADDCGAHGDAHLQVGRDANHDLQWQRSSGS